MRRSATLFCLLLVMSFIMNVAGCSRLFQPSDAEVLKAIDDSGVLKGSSFSVKSPIVIVERGQRNPDGSWPVKVKMILTMEMPGGKISEPRENTTRFKIFKSKDAGGRSIWKARLGS